MDVRNVDNTINWAAVPTDVIGVIVRKCSIRDLVILTRVNKRIRNTVILMAPDVLTRYRQFKRLLPPELDFSESIIDNLESVANKIEFVPIIGTAISIIRTLGGCFLNVFWEGSKCVYYKREDLAICEMNRQRAYRNMSGGYFRALPCIGIGFNIAMMNQLSQDKIQAHAVKCLEEVREYSYWKVRIQPQLMANPKISEEKKEVLRKLFKQIPSKKSIKEELISVARGGIGEKTYYDLIRRINSIIEAVWHIQDELSYLV